MRKNITLFIIVLLSGFGWSTSAQTTILDQSLLTQSSFDSFSAVSVTGTQSWYFNAQYGALCNGFMGGQSFENEDWFVSPAMDLSQTAVATLTFNHTRGNASVMNVGVAQGWYKVFATANYTGNPSTTSWTELSGLNQNITTAWQYISSGDLVIPEVAKSGNSRIAFQYRSSSSQSATWEVKNVKVTGSQPANPDASLFKIVNWNTEWLGCTLNGPSNESQQMNNVVAAMLAMNADVFCLQEITNSVANPTLTTLVNLLGAEQWEARLVPATTDDCDQTQAILYKKDKVQFLSATQLTSNLSNYNYNWSNGRLPALYNVNFIAGNNVTPVTIVNIHAKAEDDLLSSYNRRTGASQALKTILDGSGYNNKNVVLIGDFNDYLIGTTSSACQCTVSPYSNFTTDTANYSSLTKELIDANLAFGTHPLIEHIVVSNELSANYVANSAAQETVVLQTTNNFYFTTSNHLPVSATFAFSTLSNEAYTPSKNTFSVYPNPVKAALQFDRTAVSPDAKPEIYDLTGRAMRFGTLADNAVDVGTLPAGVYVLRIGTYSVRFIKE